MKLPDDRMKFSQDEIEAYRNRLIEEMKKQGATQEDFEMFEGDLFDDIVVTAMCNGRTPEDVAWAVLQ